MFIVSVVFWLLVSYSCRLLRCLIVCGVLFGNVLFVLVSCDCGLVLCLLRLFSIDCLDFVVEFVLNESFVY